MHFWQLFHPLRVLSSFVPPVGLLFRLLRLPRSRSNPFVSLTPFPEQSSSDTDLLLRLGTLGGAMALGDGFDGEAGTRLCAKIHREPDEDSKGRSTTSDDTYEKLMLSDLEIHPRAFDGRVRRWFPGFVRSGCGASSAMQRDALWRSDEGILRLFKRIYIDPIALATRETLKSQTSPFQTIIRQHRKYGITIFSEQKR